MSRLSNQLQANEDAFSDTSVLTNFVDNHDVVRFLNANSDTILFKNALAFVLLAKGIPIMYYGSEQGFNGGADPANREVLWTTNYDTSSDLYQFVANINNKARQKSNKTVVMDVDVGSNTYAFMHGSALVVVNNYGSGSTQSVSVNVGDNLADGTSLTDVVSNITATVSSGTLSFNLVDGNPAIYVSSWMKK